MALSKITANSFATQANITSLSVGTAASRALGGSANTTTIATENAGLMTIGKPYDGGATTLRLSSNPSGYGNEYYHGISMGAGSGFNIYAGGYQSHIDNNTYASNGSSTMMYFGGSSTEFGVQLYTGTNLAAANNTYINSKSYVKFLTPFQINAYGGIKTPSCEYVVSSGQSSWSTTSGGESGGLVPFQAYQCRAFVFFNGISNAIVKAANFSSVTDQGTGLYRVNFTNAMPDANYTTVGSGQGNNYAGLQFLVGNGTTAGDNTVNYVSIETRNYSNGANEPNCLYLAVFR